jgi:hypothetical protein
MFNRKEALQIDIRNRAEELFKILMPHEDPWSHEGTDFMNTMVALINAVVAHDKEV